MEKEILEFLNSQDIDCNEYGIVRTEFGNRVNLVELIYKFYNTRRDNSVIAFATKTDKGYDIEIKKAP